MKFKLEDLVKRKKKKNQVSKFFFPKVIFPFKIAPGICRISGRMVCISEMQQIPEFLETFATNFCTIYCCLQIFESVG